VEDKDMEMEECVSGPLVLYLKFLQLNSVARNEPPSMGSICIIEMNVDFRQFTVLTGILKAISSMQQNLEIIPASILCSNGSSSSHKELHRTKPYQYIIKGIQPNILTKF